MHARYLCNVLGTREVVGDDTSSNVAISMPPGAIMLSHDLHLPWRVGRFYTSILHHRNDFCLQTLTQRYLREDVSDISQIFLLLERVFEGLRVGICHNLLKSAAFSRSTWQAYEKLPNVLWKAPAQELAHALTMVVLSVSIPSIQEFFGNLRPLRVHLR